MDAISVMILTTKIFTSAARSFAVITVARDTGLTIKNSVVLSRSSFAMMPDPNKIA
jgi:hypothetical protein